MALEKSGLSKTDIENGLLDLREQYGDIFDEVAVKEAYRLNLPHRGK